MCVCVCLCLCVDFNSSLPDETDIKRMSRDIRLLLLLAKVRQNDGKLPGRVEALEQAREMQSRSVSQGERIAVCTPLLSLPSSPSPPPSLPSLPLLPLSLCLPLPPSLPCLLLPPSPLSPLLRVLKKASIDQPDSMGEHRTLAAE